MFAKKERLPVAAESVKGFRYKVFVYGDMGRGSVQEIEEIFIPYLSVVFNSIYGVDSSDRPRNAKDIDLTEVNISKALADKIQKISQLKKETQMLLENLKSDDTFSLLFNPAPDCKQSNSDKEEHVSFNDLLCSPPPLCSFSKVVPS